MKRSIQLLSAAGVICGAAALAQAVPIVKTQTFDTAASAAAGGWTGFNNNPIAGGGGVIDFSNTNNTLGNPAGEAGGLISRTSNTTAYYADTKLGNVGTFFDVTDSLQASGELFLDNNASADTQTLIGFFDVTQSPVGQGMSNLDNMIGFQITGSNNNIRATAFGGSFGGYNGSGGNAGLPINATFADGAYTWSFIYTADPFPPIPTTDGLFHYGEIVLTITPAGGGASTVLRNALAPPPPGNGQLRFTKQLDAFGMMSFNAILGTNLNTNRVFIDNLVYSAIPEPASMALMAAGAALLLRRRR